jgi:hypothetical protein
LMATNGVVSSSQQIQNYDVFALNSNLYTITGSLIGITNGLMAFTAALDNTYATDEQLLPILQATASLNTQTGSQDLVNLGISTFTGSLRSEIDLIEAYTASLKGAAIISSSTQISNYYKFAETASANTFYGNQTISGSVDVSGSLIPNVGSNQYTSSFSLGSPTNAWKDLWVGEGSVNFVNSSTGATASISLGDTNSLFVNSLKVNSSLEVGGNLIVCSSLFVLDSVDAFDLTGSLLSTNGVVSSSQQISNYNTFAVTSYGNTFYGNQTISGSLSVSGSVNIDNVIKLTPVTTATFPIGEAGMLVASSSYGFTNFYMYDGSDWKWLVTGSIA